MILQLHHRHCQVLPPPPPFVDQHNLTAAFEGDPSD
jgi:hypothetical protein